MRVGVVEDDASMLEAVEAGLHRNGFEVLSAMSGEDGVRLATSVDLVLLDLGLPDIDGLEVCQRIRKISDVPIIIVTARGDEQDRVAGLELGADDYVVKPYSMKELAARIRANVRRNAVKTHDLQYGPITVKRTEHVCLIHDEPLPLTPKEFELLSILIEEPGRVVPRKELHARIWDPVWVGSGKSLDVHVAGLRKKLAQIATIEAIRGVGYRLVSLSTDSHDS